MFYRSDSCRSQVLFSILDTMKPSYPESFFTEDYGNVVVSLIRKLSQLIEKSFVRDMFIRNDGDKLLTRLEAGEYSYLSVQKRDSTNRPSDAEYLKHHAEVAVRFRDCLK